MGKGFIFSIDQGTTGTRAFVLDIEGNIISSGSKVHNVYYPALDWVEHDPVEIYENVKFLLKYVTQLAKLNLGDIDVISITNQRATAVLWDRQTGKPLYNAIVWQCRRNSEFCNQLKKINFEKILRDKTGLIIDSSYAALKIKWILDNVEGARQKAKSGKLLAGTIDSWLIWNLTGGKVHATDYTNANSTLLFNIKNLQWDEEILRVFNIPSNILPELKPSDTIFGKTKKNIFFSSEIPISGILGDAHGALFGEQCFSAGMAKATLGTGSSVMINTGNNLITSKKGFTTLIAWSIGGRINYALEGAITCAGDALKWVKDNLGLFNSFDEVEDMANSLKDNEGVYLVPAFSGLGAPYWDTYARAAIVGLSKKSSRENIVRAALESTAYQIRDVIEIMRTESGFKINELMVHGGLTKINFVMQFISDMLNIRLEKSMIKDMSAIGSFYMAGLGIGIWKSIEDIKKIRGESQKFYPNISHETREKYYRGWKEAVKIVLTDN